MREYTVHIGESESALSVIDRIENADRRRATAVLIFAVVMMAVCFMAGRSVQAYADAPHMVSDTELQKLATTKGCTFVRQDGHLSFVCRNSGVAK